MLYGNEIRPDEGDVIDLTEHLDHSGVINSWDQNRKQVSQKCWLFLQVECKSLVVSVRSDISIHFA